MARLSKQSFSSFIFYTFTFLFLWGAAPMDALWCSSNSEILRGKCIFNHACQRACAAEQFSYGRCQTELISRPCKCFKECDGGGGGGGGYQDLIFTATTDFISPVRAPSPIIEKKITGLIFRTVVGVWVLLLLLALAVFFIVRRRKRPQTDDKELLGMDVKPYTFNCAELWTATDGFNPTNKLGQKGFGAVYKENSVMEE